MEQTAQEIGPQGQPIITVNHNYLLDERSKDAARGRSLVKMRVHNRNTRSLQIHSQHISPGVHEISVYEDHVKSVLGMVEDQRLIDRAREQFETDLAQEVAKKAEWQGSIDDVRGLIKSKSHPGINENYALVLKTTGKSVEASFHAQNKRDIKPLVSAEVIANSEHPEPQRKDTVREIEKYAQAQADALRVVARELLSELKGTGTAAPSEDRIAALVDARVKELLGEKQAAQKSR